MANLSGAPTRTSAHGRAVGGELRDILGTLSRVLGKRAVSEIVGKEVRTVDRWLNGKPTAPVESERILRDTHQIYEILAAVDGDHVVRAWFLGMNPDLDDRAPIELLAAGEPRPVVAAARAFADS